MAWIKCYTSHLLYVSFFSGATLSIQETEISVTEGTDGQICIVLENAAAGLERGISVTLTTTAGTTGNRLLNLVTVKDIFATFPYILFLSIVHVQNTFFLISGVNDFSPLGNEVLTIPFTMAISSFVCHNISVSDDMIVEDSETFTITVETSNPNDVIMGPTTAIVTILDDDGKYNQLKYSLFTSLVVSRWFLCTATNYTLYNLFPSYPGATVLIQETEINISEETSGQICIVLENAAGGLERDISVNLTTTAWTAGKYNR